MGCSTGPESRSSWSAPGVTDLGHVDLADHTWGDYTLSGGRNCRVQLTALPDHRVVVEVVILRTDAQGQTRILARPRTIANYGQKVSLEINEGSVTLIPEPKLAATQ